MYDKIIEEWQRHEAALTLAARLNIGPIALHLEAQAEGYELASHSFDSLTQDHEGCKGALTILEETHRILVDAGTILTQRQLTTIADTVSVCIAALRLKIHKKEENETPNNT